MATIWSPESPDLHQRALNHPTNQEDTQTLPQTNIKKKEKLDPKMVMAITVALDYCEHGVVVSRHAIFGGDNKR